MRVSAAIKSIIHGVTTDNLVNANPLYMAEQVNTITRVDEGLTKRPPTEIVADMGASLASDGSEFVKDFVIHDVAYFLVVRSTGMTLYREDGAVFTVTQDGDPDTYLDDATEADLKLAVHGELVFILNSKRTVQMSETTNSYNTNSLLFIKKPVEQGSLIKVTAVNHLNARIVKSITVPATLLGTAPDRIATQIASAFNAEATFSAASAGAVVQIVRDDGLYAQVTVDADFGVNEYFVTMNGRVETFDDLPRFSYHNNLTLVKPRDESTGGEVWMRAVAEAYKDEEDAGLDPEPEWGAPTFNDVPLRWYEALYNTPITGEPTDGTKTYDLKYDRTVQGGTYTYDGVVVQEILFGRLPSGWTGTPTYSLFDDTLTLILFTGVTTSYASGTDVDFRYTADADWQNTLRSRTLRHSIIGGTNSIWIVYGSPGVVGDPGLRAGDILDVWFNESKVAPSVNTTLIQVKWIEAARDEILIDIDRTTMPHVLNPSGGNFLYQAVNWDDRRAGDDVTNPLPRFIGNTITDVTIFQNRLAFLTKDEFCASETSNVFNFFRGTVTSVLSKQPVNLRSTSSKSSKLNHFVYHNRDLLITAGKQQYKIDGSIAFDARTASMQLTTSYNASETTAPVSIGNSVYIPSESGEYLHLSKYNGATRNLAPDAADNITQHARKYMPSDVNSLAGLPNHGLIFANYSMGQDLYVCNYDTMLSREEDQRYAWFKWNDFTSDPLYTIRSIATTKDKLVIIIDASTGLSMLNMDIDSGIGKVYMDFQRVETSINTTITVGANYPVPLADIVVVQGAGCPSPGDYVDTVSLVAGVLTIDTDMDGGTVYVGKEFNVQVVPNLVSVRDAGGHINNAANLRINGFEVRVRDTGIMTATERSPWDTYETQEFTGLVSGSLDAITDQEAKTTAVFNIGFKQKADEGTILLESKSWLPMTITQIDWTGNYTSRGRRF